MLACSDAGIGCQSHPARRADSWTHFWQARGSLWCSCQDRIACLSHEAHRPAVALAGQAATSILNKSVEEMDVWIPG